MNLGKVQDLINLMVSANDPDEGKIQGFFIDLLYSPLGIDEEAVQQIEDKLIEYGVM